GECADARHGGDKLVEVDRGLGDERWVDGLVGAPSVPNEARPIAHLRFGVLDLGGVCGNIWLPFPPDATGDGDPWCEWHDFAVASDLRASSSPCITSFHP